MQIATSLADVTMMITRAIDDDLDRRIAEFEELDLPPLERCCLIASARARRQSMIDEAVGKTMRFIDQPNAPSLEAH